MQTSGRLRIERMGGAGEAAIAPRGTGALAVVPQPPAGYRTVEFLVRGTATTYTGPPTEPATATGHRSSFSTRVLFRFPEQPDRFSGRVFLEPFNTSRNGVDADIVWGQLEPLLTSNGDAWLGVTVRSSAAAQLRRFDGERYDVVDLATNDLEWDILRQIGLAVKEGDNDLVPTGHSVDHLYMVGYSQSGVALRRLSPLHLQGACRERWTVHTHRRRGPAEPRQSG